MKAFKQNGNTIIMCIIEVIAGVLLLVDPVGFTTGIIITVGIALMAGGLLNVIRYFRRSPAEAVFDMVTLIMSRKDNGSTEA